MNIYQSYDYNIEVLIITSAILIDQTADYIAKFIEDNNIDFDRGNPRDYFKKIIPIHTGLQLVDLSKNSQFENLKIKSLYSLWNILVDDEIDNLKTNEELISTQKYLSQKNNSSTQSEKVISEIFNIINSRDIDLFINDLKNIINAFEYEYLINKDFNIVSKQEYIERSAVTIDIKIFSSIDFAFNKDIRNYGMIREAFGQYTIAMKLASDIGSGLRELIDEKNINYIILRMIEDKHLDKNLKSLKTNIELVRIFDSYKKEVSSLIKKYKIKGHNILKKIVEPKIYKRISHTVDKFIENYIEKDYFNNKLGS